MESKRTILISRKFDKDSGSAEWILADNIYDYMIGKKRDVKKIEHKHGPKIWNDWVTMPIKCLWYRIKGYNHFFFISENQSIPVPLLNFTGATTQVYFHDMMRIQNKKRGFDHYYYIMIYLLASRAKQITVNSVKTGKEVVSYFGDGMYDKITIIPPYVKEFNIDKTHRRYDVIGYLGSLSKRKRPLKLIELAKELKYNSSNYKIEVWGEGKMKDRMKTMIKQFQLEKYIELKGHAPESEKEKIYNTFGYFFFPTENEGYGLPCHEAISCGVPTFILDDAQIPIEVKQYCIPINNVTEVLKGIEVLRNNMGYAS